jgi:hypothetical protein
MQYNLDTTRIPDSAPIRARRPRRVERVEEPAITIRSGSAGRGRPDLLSIRQPLRQLLFEVSDTQTV